MINTMTPTEQDKELREQVATIVEYWDFSPLQDEDSRIERLNNQIMQLITADRKRVALDARIDELTLLADFQMGDITVMGRNERSWRDRISELEQTINGKELQGN